MFKYCALLSLCAWGSFANDFLTGQGARLVIGQTTFTQQDFGASDTLLGGVGGVAYANGNLFLADSNRPGYTPINNRVLIVPTQSFPGPHDALAPYSSRCPVCVGQASVVLGQPDFATTTFTITASGMRVPTATASDGTYLAVADTVNNRVLLWNHIPTNNGDPANVVLGQSSFTTVKTLQPNAVDAKTLRAPQGVWIYGGKLYVADTQDHRVLIWNKMPTTNEQVPDLVLGQANFTSAVEPDLTKPSLDAAANTLLNPVSVTTDGTRLFVADLGHNRVLIWNTLPTRNQQPADVVIGQQDFTGAFGNDVTTLCQPVDFNRDGVDDTDPTTGDKIYPGRCGKTLDFPRFALSDGTRLFIADGGNDRVLIYNTIPTANTPIPDVILGQPDDTSDVVSSQTDLFHPLLRQSAADIVVSPTALAWDGTNLYVADPSNRRVLVFTAGDVLLPINSVVNSASRAIFAKGAVGVQLGTNTNSDGTTTTKPVRAGDTITVTIGSLTYTYTINSKDTIESILIGIAQVINAKNGNPQVFAAYEPTLGIVKLQAKIPGSAGNDILLLVTTSDNANEVPAASGTFLQGGGDATVISPGTLVQVVGNNLAPTTAQADLSALYLPIDLGNAEAYFDGIRSPLTFVSPTQVNAQMPLEVLGSNNVSFFLRFQDPDGTVRVTNAIAVPVDEINPGLFAQEGDEPRAAIAFHSSSYATGTITVDAAELPIGDGDQIVITIEDRTYTYVAKSTDTETSVRDALVTLINANSEEKVVAFPVAAFHRLQLRAKVAGPAGEGIAYSATSTPAANGGSALSVTSTGAVLCCSNVKDTPVTLDNPAVPGETIYMFATGLGPVVPLAAFDKAVTGRMYLGPALNGPDERGVVHFVASQAGGSTANVISAGLEVGAHGLYRIVLELSPGLVVSGNVADLTISQYIYTSNTVELPIRDPLVTNLQ